MRFRNYWGLAGLSAVVAAGLLGVASAQNTESKTTRTVAPGELRSKAAAIDSTADQRYKTVQLMLAAARSNNDVIKRLCLEDKLTQMKSARDSLKSRMAALSGAAEQKDSDQAQHEFSMVEQHGKSVDDLLGQANQCVGNEVNITTEEAEVQVEVSSDLPREDPSEYPVGSIISAPPNCASCYK